MKELLKSGTVGSSDISKYYCVIAMPEMFKVVNDHLPEIIEIVDSTESAVEKIIISYFLKHSWKIEQSDNIIGVIERDEFIRSIELLARREVHELRDKCHHMIDKLYLELAAVLRGASVVRILRCTRAKNEVALSVTIPSMTIH